MSLLGRAVRAFPGRRRLIVGLGVGAVVVAQLEAVVFLVIAGVAAAVAQGKTTLSTGLPGVDVDLSVRNALAFGIVAVVLATAGSVVLAIAQANAGAQIQKQTRDRLVAAFAAADWEYQSAQRSGTLQGASGLAQATSRAFSALTTWIRSTATVAVYVLTALVVDLAAAAAVVLLGAALAATIVPLRRRTRRAASTLSRLSVEYGREVSEAGERALDLRVFEAWPRILDRLRVLSSQVAGASARVAKLSALVPVAYQFGGLLVVLVVLLLVGSAEGDIAAWAAAGLLLLRSVQYGQAVQSSLQVLAEAVPALELMDTEYAAPPPTVAFGDEVLAPVRTIELQGVSYVYPEGALPALHEVSTSLQCGEVVGLAGPSGSGKTTVGQVLLRLRPPTEGAVLVNGTDAAAFSEHSWFDRVAYVPQQPQLVRGTLYDNVSYLSGAGPELVRDAIEAAGLGDLMSSLPGGLDGLIGPGHRNLSGGQVQRIGIARALARTPDVIILDEPTSALDHASEMVVHDSLGTLRRSRDLIIVVIAHRETTLSVCDRVLHLDRGRIVQETRPGR